MMLKKIDWEKIDDKIKSMKELAKDHATKIFKQSQKGAFFKWVPLSKKQKKVFTWWTDDSPVKNADGIIADGAIRSGKSVCMSTSFVFWAMNTFEHQSFAIAGKTIGSLRRNVVFWLKIILKLRGYSVHDSRTDNVITIRKDGNVNFFYLFGGKDERSQDLIQGITLAGLLLDEVAIMPESFVNQATGRCSVDGSKIWFNCNPRGPFHYFKTNWIDKRKLKNLLYLHFTMDDNLSLSEKIKERYQRMYSGIFFKRYILGLWVIAQGIMYDMFDEEKNVKHITENWERVLVAIDYGIQNPMTYGLYGAKQGHYHLIDYYYHCGKTTGKQKTDSLYADDLEDFISKHCNAHKVKYVTIDPSATSFISELRTRKFFKDKNIKIIPAKNAVMKGIQLLSTKIQEGKFTIEPHCIEDIKEFASYIWDEKATAKGKDEPLKQNDHCLIGDTIINTPDGNFKIKDLVGHTGRVFCYDEKNQVPTISDFYDVRKTRSNVEVFEIELEDGRKIRATDEHLILTEEGWKELKNLSNADYIIDIHV